MAYEQRALAEQLWGRRQKERLTSRLVKPSFVPSKFHLMQRRASSHEKRPQTALEVPSRRRRRSRCIHERGGSACCLKITRQRGYKALLKFGNQRHVRLTPLAVPPPQVIYDLSLERRISPAALNPLHLMLMLEVKVGQGP